MIKYLSSRLPNHQRWEDIPPRSAVKVNFSLFWARNWFNLCGNTDFSSHPPKIDKRRRSSIELSIVVVSSSILQVGNKTFPIFWNLISSKNFSVFKSSQLPGGLTMSIVQKHVPHEEIQRQNGIRCKRTRERRRAERIQSHCTLIRQVSANSAKRIRKVLNRTWAGERNVALLSQALRINPPARPSQRNRSINGRLNAAISQQARSRGAEWSSTTDVVWWRWKRWAPQTTQYNYWT